MRIGKEETRALIFPVRVRSFARSPVFPTIFEPGTGYFFKGELMEAKSTFKAPTDVANDNFF